MNTDVRATREGTFTEELHAPGRSDHYRARHLLLDRGRRHVSTLIRDQEMIGSGWPTYDPSEVTYEHLHLLILHHSQKVLDVHLQSFLFQR